MDQVIIVPTCLESFSVDPGFGGFVLLEQVERDSVEPREVLGAFAAGSAFLRQRGGFVLGYAAEIAVSDDHLIVAQRVTQNATDNASLEPFADEVERRCGQPPGAALADSGFFSIDDLIRMEQRKRDAYVPDSNLTCALNLGTRYRTQACASPHARQAAKSGRPGGLCAAQGHRRAGLRSPQTATWHPPHLSRDMATLLGSPTRVPLPHTYAYLPSIPLLTFPRPSPALPSDPSKMGY